VQTYLALNLPQLKADQLLDGSQNISILAFIGLVIAGVSWVEHLRSSQRALWRLQEHPGNPIVRWIVDFAVLIGLGILILVSIAVFSGVQEFIFWLAGDFAQSPARVALRATTPIISGLVDLILGSALLLGVPRIRMSLRRLAPAAVLFAVGFGLLKSLGKWYITRTEHNPAYQVVAGTVGLLLFMYLFHQLLLFAAAIAATDQHGRVVDLAGGKVHEDLTALAASAERAATLVEEAAEATERAAQAAAAPSEASTETDSPASGAGSPGPGADSPASGAGSESRPDGGSGPGSDGGSGSGARSGSGGVSGSGSGSGSETDGESGSGGRSGSKSSGGSGASGAALAPTARAAAAPLEPSA
jgi:membrane protein